MKEIKVIWRPEHSRFCIRAQNTKPTILNHQTQLPKCFHYFEQESLTHKPKTEWSMSKRQKSSQIIDFQVKIYHYFLQIKTR